MADTAKNWTWVNTETGTPDDEWRRRFERMRQAEARGDRQVAIQALQICAAADYIHGDLVRAEARYRQSIHLARAVGNPQREAAGLDDLGSVLLQRRRYA